MLLLLYFLLYFAIAFALRALLVRRRTGNNPFVLGSSDNAHDFIGQLFRITVIGVVVVVVLNAVAPAGLRFLGPIAWLERGWAHLLGWALLIASLLWIALAQAQMGTSWRIGIDAQKRTDLVQGGLFRWSRNPIFLGMRVNLLGFFLVLPNAVTLALLVAGDLLMQIQVRLEEEHLLGLHGDAYQAYRQTVRRWL